MEIIFFIIFFIGAIITFKTKEKSFPKYPYLGWIVCMLVVAVGLYLMCIALDNIADTASYNAGYNEAYNSIYRK